MNRETFVEDEGGHGVNAEPMRPVKLVSYLFRPLFRRQVVENSLTFHAGRRGKVCQEAVVGNVAPIREVGFEELFGQLVLDLRTILTLGQAEQTMGRERVDRLSVSEP